MCYEGSDRITVRFHKLEKKKACVWAAVKLPVGVVDHC